MGSDQGASKAKRSDSPSDADPREKWPTRGEAAKRLEVDLSTVRRMQRRGDLKPELVNGVWRFNPDEIDSAAPPEENVAQEILDAATALLRQSHAHNEVVLQRAHSNTEKLLELIALPMKTLGEQLAAENKSLRKRNAELEAKNTEMLDAAEGALTTAHDREQASKQLEAEQRRKDMLLQLLLQYAPHLAEQFVKRMVDPNAAAANAPPRSPPNIATARASDASPSPTTTSETTNADGDAANLDDLRSLANGFTDFARMLTPESITAMLAEKMISLEQAEALQKLLAKTDDGHVH